ncbi:MAG TPA: hypothetical protein GXX30_02485 [Firmicutes bacterium]|nr:hypothetical protein [Candidatus Fermentithermobacillaceae bacterium]
MARKYDEKVGVGAIISSMIPYSVARGLGTPAPSLDGPETAFGSRAPKRAQGRRGAHIAYRAAAGTLTSWFPFKTTLQMKELLASDLATKVLGIGITAVAWGFFEGFNYVVIIDKINKRYPPKNLWLNPGAIGCGLFCLLIHGLVGVTPDALVEAVTVFIIIYGMLVVKAYT